jgi:hypothetical protein
VDQRQLIDISPCAPVTRSRARLSKIGCSYSERFSAATDLRVLQSYLRSVGV